MFLSGFPLDNVICYFFFTERIEFEFSFGRGKIPDSSGGWNLGPWVILGAFGIASLLIYNASRYEKITWKDFVDNFLQK